MQYFVPEQLGTIKPLISIYDVRGHEIEKHQVGPLNPGMHEFRWNAETRSSGIYFIQLSFENTSFSQKVQLLNKMDCISELLTLKFLDVMEFMNLKKKKMVYLN